MVYQVISKLENGEELYFNTKGCEDIEINDFNEIGAFSDNSKSRLIGLAKRGIFRLTLKSYKALKKELTRKGIIWRFDSSKR